MMLFEQINVLILPQALRADENFQECINYQIAIRPIVWLTHQSSPECLYAGTGMEWSIIHKTVPPLQTE